MARTYLEAIKRVQRRGPYYLGGYSAGGAIAYEMASQLVAANEQVALLVMLDKRAPFSGGRMQHDEVMSASYLDLLGVLFREQFGTVDWAPELDALRAMPADEQLAAVLAHAQKGKAVPASITVDQFRAMADVVRLNRAATLIYEPSPIGCPVVVVRSAERALLGPDDPRHLGDLGWGRYCTGPFEAHDVPGSHAGMMQNPHVAEVATVVRRAIDRAASDESTASNPSR
jgi:thioesterase domain-containing protein